MDGLLVITRLHAKLHLRAGEWLTAAILTCWGVELLWWPQIFQRDFFAGFLQIASQPVWAAALLLIGGFRLLALLINGAWRYSAHLRMFLLGCSVPIWAALVHGVWASNLATISIVVYPWLALMDVYSGYRAGRDARLAMGEVHLTLKAT